MKKILTILSVCGFSAAVFAQGTVNWLAPGSAFIGQTNNTAYSGFVASSGTPGGNGLGSGNANTLGGATTLFYYALLTSTGLSASPTSLSQFNGGTLANSWLSTGLMMTNSSANGRVSPVGGVVANAPASNWADQSTQNDVLVGWSANLGTTWATALANLNNWAAFGQSVVGTAYFGVSSTGSSTLGVANPGNTLIGINPGQINGTVGTGNPIQLNPLFVTPVPEPATIALAGLGGLALLALRRKK